MSHLVKGECGLNDLQTLLDAARALGWEVRQSERVRYFMGQGDICEYTLELRGEVTDYGKPLEGRFNIGIQRDEKGKIILLHDNAMNGRTVVEEGQYDPCTTRIINKLKQEYQITATQKFARQAHKRIVDKGKVGNKRVIEIEV